MTGSPPFASPDHPNPLLRVLGWLLAVLGGLWVLLAGGCTLIYVIMDLDELRQGLSAPKDYLPIVYAVGAVIILPGVALLVGGIWMLRRQKRVRGEDG